MKRNYYKVAVPTDAFETDQERANYAIDEARERARLYCIPATWTAKKIGENALETIFRVVRFHN